MQVFPSYFLCVKLLSAVILCSQNIVVAEDLDTANNTVATTVTTTVAIGLSSDTENITTELPTTVILNTSTVISIVTEIPVASTTASSSTSIENFTNGSSPYTNSSTSEYTTNGTSPYTNSPTSEYTTNGTSPYTNSPTSEYTTNGTSPYTNSPTSEYTTTPFTQSTNSTSDRTASSDTTDNNTTTSSPSTRPSNVTTELPCDPLNYFNLTITGISKTEANVSIQGVTNYGSVCPTPIFINCSATEDNNTLWYWVVQSQNIFYTLNDTSNHDIIIGSISEFTNYTCDLITDGLTESSFYFQTEQEVPSSPVNLNITILSSTSFNITWKEPAKIPSNLTGYQVTIERKHVASNGHIWNNCSDNENYTTVVHENSFLFDQALPDFVYDVTVVAMSNVGVGNSSSSTAITLPAAADPPIEVIAEPIEDEYNKNVTLMQNFTWNMPCNTHGPVRSFQLELNGNYQNNSTETDSRNTTLFIFENQTTYSFMVINLWTATNYTFKIYLVGNLTGMEYTGSFTTSDNYPNAPELITTVIGSQNLTITWKEPSNSPGTIMNYAVNITGEGLNWTQTQNCNVSDIYYYETNLVGNTEFYTTRIVPYATYRIFISGITSRGEGNRTELTVTSNMTYPDSLPLIPVYNITSDSQTDSYNAIVTIYFESGCFNGMFDHYDVNLTGTRTGYETSTENTLLWNPYDDTCSFALLPEYSYIATVTTRNTYYSSTIGEQLDFTAPAGVPVINTSIIASIPINTMKTQTSLTLKRIYFDESQGSLQYMAIIISNKNITGGSFGYWDTNSEWPIPTADTTIFYQATPTRWNPFSEIDTIEYIIGNDTSCNTEQFCNKPLQSNTEYFVLLRLFNGNFYRNTMPVSFITEKESNLAVILGSLGALLFVSANGFIFFILWRKGYIRMKEKKGGGYRGAIEDSSEALLSDRDEKKCTRAETAIPKTEISKKKFIEYCKYLEQNPEVLTAQWDELDKRSKIINEEQPHHFATLPENRRRNRFTNILPFDHCRVKLKIDEDDENCSDYINASLIKGFSGGHEYIATQGPLPNTCRDFWKMILQERVSIIVMVSRFIENNRDKCYKYFPNNRETMTVIGEDIEVRCSMELHFGFYCVRTLQVKKELAQETVTHMQFLDWPDFDVPDSTDTMLNFCHQFRERWTSEGGMALVHCSAGVGRTGTIIATDILLRSLAAGRKIDVFNTVLELRKQRPNMVQTKKQYMYIYQLIKSMIEFPIIDDQDDGEHLYANLELKNKDGIVESAL